MVCLGQLCPLQTTCPNIAYLLAGVGWVECSGTREGLELLKHYLAIAKMLVWVSTLLATNPKYSTAQAAMKKVNFIPARASTKRKERKDVGNTDLFALTQWHMRI